MFFNAQLFNRARPEVYQLLPCDPAYAEFGHVAGGEARHRGATPPGRPKPVHLFYELDLADPLVEVRSPRPEVTRLPLYSPLGNAGGPFQYRVVSDDEIELLSSPYPNPRRDAPKPYPKPFRHEAVYLQPINFDPKDPEWLWNYGGILGVGSLTAGEKDAVKKEFERWHRKTFKYPLLERYHEWIDGTEDDPGLDELVRMFTPFTQGMPEATCPNPDCPAREGGAPLPPLAYLQPEGDEDDEPEEKRVCRLLAGGDSGQLIWMVCPRCLSVVVENPCT